MATRPAIFEWRQTEPTLILCTVRWYLRYSLSLRNVEVLLAERGREDCPAAFRASSGDIWLPERQCRTGAGARNRIYRLQLCWDLAAEISHGCQALKLQQQEGLYVESAMLVDSLAGDLRRVCRQQEVTELLSQDHSQLDRMMARSAARRVTSKKWWQF
jgi:hypothetical protein